VDQHVAFLDLSFDEIIELGEEFADVFGLHVEEGVDYVSDGRVVGDVVEASGGGDDCVRGVGTCGDALGEDGGDVEGGLDITDEDGVVCGGVGVDLVAGLVFCSLDKVIYHLHRLYILLAQSPRFSSFINRSQEKS
jgi:hypothetical protein